MGNGNKNKFQYSQLILLVRLLSLLRRFIFEPLLFCFGVLFCDLVLFLVFDGCFGGGGVIVYLLVCCVS